MLWTQRCLRHPKQGSITLARIRSRLCHTGHDDCGIPTKPTWSVDELLLSYPKPTLSSATLLRLHQLSALIPPPEGTTQHEALKKEMEEFIRLVEAVKLVNTRGIHQAPCRDQRRTDEEPDCNLSNSQEQDVNGTELLQHAPRKQADFYLVNSDKTRQ